MFWTHAGMWSGYCCWGPLVMPCCRLFVLAPLWASAFFFLFFLTHPLGWWPVYGLEMLYSALGEGVYPFLLYRYRWAKRSHGILARWVRKQIYLYIDIKTKRLSCLAQIPRQDPRTKYIFGTVIDQNLLLPVGVCTLPAWLFVAATCVCIITRRLSRSASVMASLRSFMFCLVFR